MEDLNREYYLTDSPGRADYWRFMAAPRFRLETFLTEISDSSPGAIVDLGCGSGLLLAAMRRRFPESRLCGMDFSDTLIESSRRADPSIDWRLADLGMPQIFEQGLASSFDVVLASEIIEHVENPEVLLANAARLAKPKTGLLLLSTQSGRIWETERMVGHRRHFSALEVRALLEASGWTPRRIWNAGFPFHTFAKWSANLFPQRTMRSFSERSYGLLQRSVCFFFRMLYRFNMKSRGAQLFAVAERAP